MIGKTVSHYEILEKLGEGGLGTVYKAQDTRLDRLVALKFLHPQYGIDESEKKRFLQEARAAAGLDHPNICAVHEIDETEEGRMFIVMAFYEGETLRDRIGKQDRIPIPLPLDQAIDISLQVAAGLQRAHQSRIIHRDIKSANIIITKNHEAKIVDFGLAKLKGQPKITKTGTTTRGTVTTMSPEQVQGEKIDQRTDIWSLGVVLYEMVTGQLPFRGTYDQAIIYSILHEEPKPVSSLISHIPPELERIIQKSLKKSREERYPDMDELIRDLKKLKKQPRPGILSTGKSGFFKGLKRLVKPIRIPVLFILAIMIIISGYFLLVDRPLKKLPLITVREKIRIAIMYFQNNTRDKNLDIWRRAFTDLLITDLSQSRYIQVLSCDKLNSILKKSEIADAGDYSAEDLKRIASEGKASYIMQGNYTKAGNSFRINITIQDASTLEIKNTAKVQGKGEESFHLLVDELTANIKKSFQFTQTKIASDIDQEIGKITTYSLEALKYFMEGKRFYKKRQFKEGINSLMKAVEIDPGFALAYRQIAENYHYLGDSIKEKEYLLKALALIDRISERESYLVHGYFYQIFEDSYEKAIQTYRELLLHYPDDEDGHIFLGSIYRNMEEWDLANEHFEKVRESNPDIAYDNFAYISLAQGQYGKAERIVRENPKFFPNPAFTHFFLSNVFLCQRKLQPALKEIKKALNIEPDNDLYISLLGNIYQIANDILGAGKWYSLLLKKDNPESRLEGHYCISHLHEIQGQFEKQKNEILTGMRLSREFRQKYYESSFTRLLIHLSMQLNKFQEALDISDGALKLTLEAGLKSDLEAAIHFQGLSLLKLQRMKEATQTARELKKVIEKSGVKKNWRQFYHLLGAIDQEKGLLSPAILYYEKAISLLPAERWGSLNFQAFYLNSLAIACFNAKKYEKSRLTYEKIISLTLGRLEWGGIYVKSFYWLGKIYQAQGLKGKAIGYFQRFLQLWKNADSDIPELKDARDKLALLRTGYRKQSLPDYF